MRQNKILMKLLALGTAFTLSGCSAGGSVDMLLTPPKLSEEQSAVYDALVKSVGNDIRLQYPRSGDFRSAFLFANIDDEPDNEAIVFYEKNGETKDGANVRVNVIDRRDGKWTSVYDHSGMGTEIDRIFFSEIGNSSRTRIIIGYTLLSGEKSVKVYSYSDGMLIPEYTDIYSTMFISDLERDNRNELVLIRPNNHLKKASVGLVSVNDDGKIVETSNVALSDSTTDFVNIASGYVGSGTPAIFIDGLSNGKLSTEIIYSVNGQLRNPLYLGESAMIEQTLRQTGYPCTDIDLDGIIEIPILTLFPGYSETTPGIKLYSAEWMVLDNYNITKKYSSYYNVSDGYCFILPSRWDGGVVTAKPDNVTGEIVFYKYHIDLDNSTTELMRIAVASDEETDALLDEGYILVKSNNNTNYLVKCPAISNEPLILTGTEISNSFFILAK
ncbi:MAG: hypothetical protein J6K17_12015 [Oscillospiraceae bacterium]|nr:hypothetical protein [Oscillospiraceae bacterium]